MPLPVRVSVEVPMVAPAKVATGLVVWVAAPARPIRTTDSRPTRARATRMRRFTMLPPQIWVDRIERLDAQRIGRAAQTGITAHSLALLGARYAACLASSAGNDSLRSAGNSVEVGRPPAAA